MKNPNPAPAAKSEEDSAYRWGYPVDPKPETRGRKRFAPDPQSPLTKGQQRAVAKQAKQHPLLFDVDAAEYTLPLFKGKRT